MMLSVMLRGLLLSVMLMGCHAKAPVVAPLPVRVPPSLEEVRQALETQEALESLSASFELVVQQDQKKDRVQGALALMRAPDGPRMRLELYSPLGPPLAYAVMTPDEVSLYLPYSKAVLYSPEPEKLLRRESGGRLGLADVLGAMLGGMPPCVPKEPVTFRATDDRFLVPCEAIQAGEPTLSLMLSPEPLKLAGLEAGGAGAYPAMTPFRVRFEGRSGEMPVPARWILESEGVALELRLIREELSLNVPLEQTLFRLELPENTQVASLEHWLEGLRKKNTP
ncbi:MAG: hypothetical protein ACKO6N_21830 [Myxococcota bacterium]